jgi:hypothetical protein
MSAKRRTIDEMKERRGASSEARERVKVYAAISKEIRNALQAGPLTIPEIAERTRRSPDEITYTLMTMRKLGVVETHIEDDVDDYYRYKLKD